MAAHSYWRISWRAEGAGTTQFSEVFFYAANVDLCSGGTVIKSSEFGSPYLAANAFDRNTSTNYARGGAAVAEWIGYIFPSPVEPDEIGFTASSTFPGQNCRSFAVSFSDDGVTWYLHSLVDDSGGAMGSGVHREFAITELDMDAWDTSPHRYWRLLTIFNGLDGFQSIAEVDFLLGGVSQNDAHAFTASASSAQGSFPASQAFDNNNATQWYTAGINVSCWLKIDYGVGNAYGCDEIRIRAPASDFTRCPRQMLVQYSDDNVNWVIRHATTFRTWTAAQDVTETFATPTVSADFVFDYKIEAPRVEAERVFDYKIEAPKVEASRVFDYTIFGPISASFTFDYKVLLFTIRTFNYHIEAELGDILGYRHIYPATADKPKRAVTNDHTASIIGEALDAIIDGAIADIDHVVLDPVVSYLHLHFYADFYQRIWIDPSDYRLSNPKIGFEYAFDVWSAFDRPNQIVDFTMIDLVGVTFVEAYDLPVDFIEYELRQLHFIIGADAPSTVQGTIDFDFTLGEGLINIFAFVLGVLKTLPNEPMTEVWTWFTIKEVSANGTEQRMSMRDQPRTVVSYDVILEDEADRIAAYQQLYSFASRSVLVPLFQYLTTLNASVLEGDTIIYFDIDKSDIREGEYLIFFNRAEGLFDLIQVLSLNVDGVDLVTPVGQDYDEDQWEVIPGRSMRLPNKSALDMAAVDGGATFKGESTVWRDLLRPGSTVVLETVDGHPVLPYVPIAQTAIDETFDSDVETIDNDSAEPVQRSTFTNPFVESTKSWQIDREEDGVMDWWRAFFDHCKGMLRPFLIPTWRDDLPLIEEPTLGDESFLTSNTDFVDYFAHNTYGWVQVRSDAGVIYRRVVSAALSGAGALVTMNEGIGVTEGSDQNVVVSFLNLARLNDDQVQLNHFVNWTIVTLETRTVNQ